MYGNDSTQRKRDSHPPPLREVEGVAIMAPL